MTDLNEEWLDRPRTVADLAATAKCSESKIRRWLDSMGDRVSIGYTRPRTYWLPEQEAIRDRITCRNETQTIASRNAMDRPYNFK